jgi:hypothetical protein
MCVLCDKFFFKVYASGHPFTPLLLAMAATMPASLMDPFSKLTHVDFSLTRHQLWASVRDFQQRNISMEVHTKNNVDLNKSALRPVVDLLRESSEAYVCIFVKF